MVKRERLDGAQVLDLRDERVGRVARDFAANERVWQLHAQLV